jgi:hypothetical protein
MHDPRPREGFRKQDDVRVLALDIGDRPLPKGKGFRVRVVDAENRDAALDPVLEDGTQLTPQAPPVFAFEVERATKVLGLLGNQLDLVHAG